MKYKISFIILLFLTNSHKGYADALISFFLQAYPKVFPENYAHELENKLNKPGKIARQNVHHQYNENIVDGIFSTYGGFIDISDVNGQTSFPLKHAKPRIILVVTTKITPIIMSGNTIHHWELEEGTPADLYLIEKKQDDKTKLFYWDAQSYVYPKDRKISAEALVLLARPKDIYVPTGISIARKSTHLILPTIFVKKVLKQLIMRFIH